MIYNTGVGFNEYTKELIKHYAARTSTNPLKLWAGSVRVKGRNLVITAPAYVVANTEGEAIYKLLNNALLRYPVNDGWYGHSVIVIVVDDDTIDIVSKE